MVTLCPPPRAHIRAKEARTESAPPPRNHTPHRSTDTPPPRNHTAHQTTDTTQSTHHTIHTMHPAQPLRPPPLPGTTHAGSTDTDTYARPPAGRYGHHTKTRPPHIPPGTDSLPDQRMPGPPPGDTDTHLTSQARHSDQSKTAHASHKPDMHARRPHISDQIPCSKNRNRPHGHIRPRTNYTSTSC